MHDAAIIGLLRRGHALRPQNSRLQTLKVLAVPPPVLLIELLSGICTSRHRDIASSLNCLSSHCSRSLEGDVGTLLLQVPCHPTPEPWRHRLAESRLRLQVPK